MHTFAVRRLYVGDTLPTPAFTKSATAWQALGYDLDRLDTTSSTATNTCTPHTPGGTVIDGVGGIDNAFGSVIVGDGTLLASLQVAASQGSDASATDPLSKILSEQIGAGACTALINTVGIEDDVALQSSVSLTGGTFTGGAYGGNPPQKPSGDAATDFLIDASWPVSRSSLVDGGTIENGGVVRFGEAYISNGVWVSGSVNAQPPEPVTMPLTLIIGGHP
jgi:hypothetical protein